MKGRVALFAGYFVGVLLIASWLTGVLQKGVVATLLSSSDPLRYDPTIAMSEVKGEAPAPVLSPVEGPTPDQVEHPTASPSQDQAPRDPSRVALQRSLGQAPFDQAQGRLRLGSEQARAQCDLAMVSERDAVHKALEAKWAELDRLEDRLRRQREQNLIEERWLEKMKSSRAMVTKGRDAQQEAGIMKLAKLYEGMEPEAAASILGSLEKELATNVLASMKNRQASKVLGAMNGPRARELSERLHDARPNRPNAGELNE